MKTSKSPQIKALFHTKKPIIRTSACQSASDRDPGSASKRDPRFLRFERLALAPSELVGVAETGASAGCGVIVVAALETPAVIASFDDIAVVGQAIEQRSGHLGVAEHAGPFAEGEVRGDDDRGSLVEPADTVSISD